MKGFDEYTRKNLMLKDYDDTFCGERYFMFSPGGEAIASLYTENVIGMIKRGTIKDRRRLVKESSRIWRSLMRTHGEAFDSEPRAAMAHHINAAWQEQGHEPVHYTDLFLFDMRQYRELA